MDTLLNIRAFLAIADAGSLSSAARRLNVAPSVISKRIARLEDEMGSQLFVRTTRRTQITPVGERFLPEFRRLVKALDETLEGARRSAHQLQGSVRVKCPTTIAIAHFGRFFREFQARHSNVSVELVLIDRSVNPLEEGFDIALGAIPTSYPGVVDVPLCPHGNVLCASPDYLDRRGWPAHPSELADHDCLVIIASGVNWTFQGAQGELIVPVTSRFAVNDGQVLHEAACHGAGVAIIGEYVARESIRSGRLVHLLPEFPVKALWLKALVPVKKMDEPLIRELLQALKDFTQPLPPWDRPPFVAG
jgi:DNA-binding transcriptional LysR family regulator